MNLGKGYPVDDLPKNLSKSSKFLKLKGDISNSIKKGSSPAIIAHYPQIAPY